MTKLLVMGGSSGIGLACVQEALARGHEVRMFSRSASQSALSHQRLETLDGDARVDADVERALEGVHAVLQTLGVPLGLKLITGPITLFSKSTEVLLPALERAGITRLIALTGFGAGDSNASISLLQRPGFNLMLGKAYADKSRQEAMIKGTELDWTIARPGVLRNGSKTGRYKVITDPQAWRNGIIRRADVADFMVGAVESDRHKHQAPVLITHGFSPFGA